MRTTSAIGFLQPPQSGEDTEEQSHGVVGSNVFAEYASAWTSEGYQDEYPRVWASG